MAEVWREGWDVSMQKHVYNMQCFKISEPQAQSPPSYLYHAHKARQTAETSSEWVWFSCANINLNTLQISGKEEKQLCCKTNKLQRRSKRGGWGKVCTHSMGAKPGKRTCTRQGQQSATPRRKLSTGLPSPPVQQQRWAEAAANIWGQRCRTTHASPVPRSSRLIPHRGFQKGGSGREETEHLLAFNLYLQGQLYHKPERSSTGNCPDERHCFGQSLILEVCNKNTQLQVQTVFKILQSLWCRICGHNLHFQWCQPPQL